jgi:predicted nuclease of predicted toxin-antitoxin system
MKLLLDENISPAVVEAVKRFDASIDIRHMHTLTPRATPDPDLLRVAHAAGYVLVSYDTKTLPSHVRDFLERAEPFSGVILVNSRTIAHQDIGGLARALVRLVNESGEQSWTNCTHFLRK